MLSGLFKIFVFSFIPVISYFVDDVTTPVDLELPLEADWDPRLDEEDTENFDETYYERVKTDIELEVLLSLNLATEFAMLQQNYRNVHPVRTSEYPHFLKILEITVSAVTIGQ